MNKEVNRRGSLAKRLALWSISDQISHEVVDKEVLRFSQDNEELSKELQDLEVKIAELIINQKKIARKLIASCKDNISVLEDQTPNNIARPLVDLVFWNRMSDLNPDLYNMLHANIEEIGDE